MMNETQHSNHHAAMQQRTRIPRVQIYDHVFAAQWYSDRHKTKLCQTACNVREMCGRRGWDRHRLASESTTDIRTVNRVYLAQPVKASTLKRISLALGVWPWELSNLPHEQFLVAADRALERERQHEIAQTVTEVERPRPPWWRRVIRWVKGERS